MIRQRPGKERIHFEAWNLDHLPSILAGHLCKEALADDERGEHHKKHRPGRDMTPSIHTILLFPNSAVEAHPTRD
jgi:hypothetical protein